MNSADRIGPPIGRVYQDAAGSFIRYSVVPNARQVSYRGRAPREVATSSARATAKNNGLRVLDVASATQQPDGSWIVELRVVTEVAS